MKGIKVYCLMSSSKGGLDEYTSDVIMVNAYDMWHYRNRHQPIRTGKCDGIIRSNLRPVQHMGVPVVLFDALVSDSQWECNEIKCYIRVDDLEVPPTAERMGLLQMGGPPMLPPFDFAYDDGEDDEPEYDLGEPAY